MTVNSVTLGVYSYADGKCDATMQRLSHIADGQRAAKNAERTAETEVDFEGGREQATEQNDGAHSEGIELVVILDSAGGQGGQEWNS